MANEIGKRIQFARKRQKITQQKMADDLGFSRSTIGFLETGHLMPSVEALYSYCAYLDVPVQFVTDPTWPMTEDGLELSKMVSRLTEQDMQRLKPYLDVYLENKNRN